MSNNNFGKIISAPLGVFPVDKWLATMRENTMPRSIVRLARSRVNGGVVFVVKEAPAHLLDNEEYALEAMGQVARDLVPRFRRVTREMMFLEYIANEPVTDRMKFLDTQDRVLDAMEQAGLRHGDLTEFSILVRDNSPVIIDWAESRTWNDPRPDKRPQGDAYLLSVAMERISGGIDVHTSEW